MERKNDPLGRANGIVTRPIFVIIIGVITALVVKYEFEEIIGFLVSALFFYAAGAVIVYLAAISWAWYQFYIQRRVVDSRVSDFVEGGPKNYIEILDFLRNEGVVIPITLYLHNRLSRLVRRGTLEMKRTEGSILPKDEYYSLAS